MLFSGNFLLDPLWKRLNRAIFQPFQPIALIMPVTEKTLLIASLVHNHIHTREYTLYCC